MVHCGGGQQGREITIVLLFSTRNTYRTMIMMVVFQRLCFFRVASTRWQINAHYCELATMLPHVHCTVSSKYAWCLFPDCSPGLGRNCLIFEWRVHTIAGLQFFNPFRIAVPFWGQTTQISSSLSPKRDCGSKGVKGICESLTLLQDQRAVTVLIM